jgi:hypothetical protein
MEMLIPLTIQIQRSIATLLQLLRRPCMIRKKHSESYPTPRKKEGAFWVIL